MKSTKKMITVTKADMLHAARTEPLTYNAWFDTSVIMKDHCPACAVGSSLRVATKKELGSFLVFNTNIACVQLTSNQYLGYLAEFKPKRGRPNWFSRMSIFWEALGKKREHDIKMSGDLFTRNDRQKVAEELRPQLIAWIEANVPDGYQKKLKVQL